MMAPLTTVPLAQLVPTVHSQMTAQSLSATQVVVITTTHLLELLQGQLSCQVRNLLVLTKSLLTVLTAPTGMTLVLQLVLNVVQVTCAPIQRESRTKVEKSLVPLALLPCKADNHSVIVAHQDMDAQMPPQRLSVAQESSPLEEPLHALSVLWVMSVPRETFHHNCVQLEHTLLSVSPHAQSVTRLAQLVMTP